MSTTAGQIIDEAMAAHAAAATAQFERDGRKDVGTCGMYQLAIDARTCVGKELLRRKMAIRGRGAMFIGRLPEGVSSQNIELHRLAGEAARDVFEKHGIRILRAYAWVD